MAEYILRVIGALIGALIRGLTEYLLLRTGRRVLAAWGIKSNPFVEVLVGMLSWTAFGFLMLAVVAGLMTLLRFAQHH
jgi:hypothetical protein